MKKQVRTLIEIGVAYLAISIVLDFFLAGYPVLTWSALAFAFLVFAVLIISVVLELAARPAVRMVPHVTAHEDELVRLERLSQKALDERDPDASVLLSQRLKSVAFAVVAYRFNTSEALLRNTAEKESDSLRDQLGDQELVEALTTKDSLVNRSTLRNLEYYLTKIEDWSN
jgi:heme exporter protein D